MKTTNKKECPKCKSVNVIDTGNKINDDRDNPSYPQSAKPIYPVYKCKDCGESFIFEELEED